LIQININLLGVERKDALARKGLPIDKGLVSALGTVIIAAVIILLSSTVLSNLVAKAEDQKMANEATLQKLDVQLKEIESLEKQKQNLIMEEKILRYVTGETYRWSYLLQEIRTLMPIDVQIDDLKIDNSGSFSLKGTATDHRSVALFLSSLQSSKMLSDVTLRSSIKDNEKSATSFVITCKKTEAKTEAN